MLRTLWLSRLVLLTSIALVFAGCGDDSHSAGGDDAGDGGGKVDSGPEMVADAGNDASMMMPPKGPPMSDKYSLEACPGGMGTELISAFDSLEDCSDICGGGRCVPAAIAGGASSMTDALPKCADGTSVCIPKAIAVTGGSFKFAACESLLDKDMTGGCVPACLAGAMASFLAQGSCAAGELCAPCTNPLDMMPTGACDLLECPGEGDDGGTGDGG